MRVGAKNHSRTPKFHFNQRRKVSEYASLDNIDKQNYVKAMTTARDTHNQIEYAKEIAHEEGLEEGLAKGRVKGPAKTGYLYLRLSRKMGNRGRTSRMCFREIDPG